MNSFLHLSDLSRAELDGLLDRADQLHRLWHSRSMPPSLAGKRVALWFHGQGFRNRLAFEIGARAMGAELSYVPGELGVHEPLEDIGDYLANWFELLVVRCQKHQDLLHLARATRLPLINGRTGFNHPCEVLGDLQYIRRQRGTLDGLRVVFFGELTNLGMSWCEAARRWPIQLTQVAPEGFGIPAEQIASWQPDMAGSIRVCHDPHEAVTRHTELIYTDCWPRQLDAAEARRLFGPHQVNEALLDRMNPQGWFLPCPPVTRGQEVSAGAMHSALCHNHRAKEFLLHAQNAVMESLLNPGD